MQSNRSRVALAVAAVAIAAIAFVVLRPSDDDEPASEPSTAQEPAAAPDEEASGSGGGARKPPDGADRNSPADGGGGPETFRIDAADGSVADVEVSQGDEVRLEVRADTQDEVHVHGYDEFADVAPGEVAEVEFTADLEGIYEIELEGSHTQIARLEVTP